MMFRWYFNIKQKMEANIFQEFLINNLRKC